MLTTIQKVRGMTLVELLIAVVIFGVLLSLGIGSFSDWIQNSQTRTAAESIMNGLQLARNEAVKRNLPAMLVLCDLNRGSNTSSWDVLVAAPSGVVATPGVAQACQADAAATTAWERVQQRTSLEGSTNVTLTINGGPVTGNAITFNSYGRLTVLAATATLPLPVAPNPLVQGITSIQATNTKASTPRPLNVVIGSAGNARMCDPSPQLLAGDPRRCQ
jgi:type IV fimbrial biogenesis protein FimT